MPALQHNALRALRSAPAPHSLCCVLAQAWRRQAPARSPPPCAAPGERADLKGASPPHVRLLYVYLTALRCSGRCTRATAACVRGVALAFRRGTAHNRLARRSPADWTNPLLQLFEARCGCSAAADHKALAQPPAARPGARGARHACAGGVSGSRPLWGATARRVVCTAHSSNAWAPRASRTASRRPLLVLHALPDCAPAPPAPAPQRHPLAHTRTPPMAPW